MLAQVKGWMRTKESAVLAIIAGILVAAGTVQAVPDPTKWTGAGADNNWSSTGNWDPAASASGKDVVFGELDRTASTVVNNIVDAGTTISSLSYTNIVGSATAHVTEIGPGVTLTVDGSTSPTYAVKIGGIVSSASPVTVAKCTGGGALVVDAEPASILIANWSGSNTPKSYFYLQDLSAFSADVDIVRVGWGPRSLGFLQLPVSGAGTSTITASRISVGNSNDGTENSGLSELQLGLVNTVHTDVLLTGAAEPGLLNVQSGKISFQTGLANPGVTIRGKTGGSSAANLVVASHGGNSVSDKSIRNISGTLDFTGGSIDAQFGSVLVAEGRGTGTGTGRCTGTLTMGAGRVEADSVVLAKGLNNDSTSTSIALILATLNVSGGTFSANTMSFAENTSKAQPIAGHLNISGNGAVSVTGDITMGTRVGTAIAITSRVDIASGKLDVGGNMVPGTETEDALPYVVGEVLLRGGALSVTNVAGTATLKINKGLFHIGGGTANLDRLVTSNALTTTRVELRGTGAGDYGQVSVSGTALLGGTLDVDFAGYEPEGGDSWTILSGAGTRTGTFAATDLPEGLQILYTPSGYTLVYPSANTLISIR